MLRLDALLLREARDGCGGRGFRRTPDALFGIGLAFADSLPRAQPGGAAWHPAGRSRAGHIQAREQRCPDTPARPQASNREFLRADFEQKGRFTAPAPAADRPRLRATPTASLRTRCDDADALGDADRAARIERIEEIAALQHVIVSRQAAGSAASPRLRYRAQQARGFGFVDFEELPQRRRRRASSKL